MTELELSALFNIRDLRMIDGTNQKTDKVEEQVTPSCIGLFL